MIINGLSIESGDVENLMIPAQGRSDNSLSLKENADGGSSLIVKTGIVPQGATNPSIGLNASLAKSVSEVQDYSWSPQGNMFVETGELVLDSSDTFEGSEVCLLSTQDTRIKFPVMNPVLYDRKFYIKYRMKIPDNNTRFFPYIHYVDNYDNRLTIGCGIAGDQNFNLWNNQQSPRISSGFNLGGAWRTVEIYYDGVSNFRAAVDRNLVYSEYYTIRPYTNHFDAVKVRMGPGARLDYYEIQIEGINWNNPEIQF